MNKLKILPGLMLAVFIIAGFAAPRSEAAGRSISETRIARLHFSVRGNRTCLIFDAEGARPKRIGPASDLGISVFFSKMATRLPDRLFRGRRIAVRAVKFRRGSGFFEVLFRRKNTSVSYRVRQGRHGRYALELILTSSAKTAGKAPPVEPAADSTENAGQKDQPIDVKKIETSQLFGSKVSRQVKDAFANELKPANAGEPPRPEGTTSKPRPFVEPGKRALALYASANEKFEDCSRNLVFCASDIIEAYAEALKAGPRSSQAPLAVYRSALAHYIMGQFTIANKLFRSVTSQWPDNPVACRCWIGIGDICLKKEAYLEAMEAFRWALRCAAGKDDKAAAYYELGKTYLVLGADKEALEMLQDCIGQEPDYYTKKPKVFRFIGEADFALGDLDKAKEFLLRYVNCQESDPDQGVVLAKIAEIFLNTGQVDAAKKMYGFVHKYYTDSEGDLICRIRRAELMEKVDLDKSIKMYNDLRRKDLSPSLRSIVLMKLAELELKKCDLEHSLALMDQAFPIKDDGSSPPGTAALRERVICDLVRQYYSNKNFGKVIQLHDKYRRVFDSIKSPETLEQVAESYASQKFYSTALQIYDKLLAQGGKNHDGMLLRCAVYALRIRDYGRALQYCKAVQSGSFDLKKSEILGQICYRDKQYADAVKYFEKVLQKTNGFEIEDPDSYAAFGYSLYHVKKFDEAVPILQTAMLQATTDNDTRRSILVTLCKCFKEQKQYARAAEMMETAIQISGKDEKNELLYEISKLYVAAGRPDKAVQSLNRIKAGNDTFWSAVAQQEINTINMAASSTEQASSE